MIEFDISYNAWVEFVDLVLCSERFSSGLSPLTKNQNVI